jgi:hypothetical protein
VKWSVAFYFYGGKPIVVAHYPLLPIREVIAIFKIPWFSTEKRGLGKSDYSALPPVPCAILPKPGIKEFGIIAHFRPTAPDFRLMHRAIKASDEQYS